MITRLYKISCDECGYQNGRMDFVSKEEAIFLLKQVGWRHAQALKDKPEVMLCPRCSDSKRAKRVAGKKLSLKDTVDNMASRGYDAEQIRATLENIGVSPEDLDLLLQDM